ncbi:Fasciclin-domain-containing protein [Cylindrobasidium torrendii FP15055 ss-10]|uniref:Fasciclin-domain-containing protein n=1 Tax=Cylindrobasidium torrendii FP15055 ss-10 TaxID=1314674 RepID=A0A0D7BLU7_9AGAR|nr:Fasciclin-domain-containing protein [Cylindrobasidium torrendii FP15055 ss-10]
MTAEYMSLAQPLAAAGYTGLVSVMASVANTSLGMALAQRIFDGGNYTIFAPDNDAIARLPMNITSDPEMLANILSYHIVSGNFSEGNGSLQAATFPNDTIARTTLNATDLVMLEGNKSQVLVWTSENGTVMIQNQLGTKVAVSNSTVLGNFLVNGINGTLMYPTNLTSTLNSRNLTSLADVLGSISASNSTNETLADKLEGLTGYTLFAPSNMALEAASQTLSSLASNTTALTNVLGNHIINGSTLYSTGLANSTSASGETLSFTTNSSGTFVASSSGSTTVAMAKIITTNVLVNNGVVHIIDTVLGNTESNSSAASSAYESAVSVAAAAATTTETGLVTGPTGASSSSNGENGDSNGGNGSSSGGNAALTPGVDSKWLFMAFSAIVFALL